MPSYRIGKDRESLHYTGEQYKQAVALWLESKGMNRIIDSSVEGTFEDLAFYNQEGVLVIVECKDTEVNIESPDFLKSFAWFLRKYSRLPSNKWFLFYYVARELTPWQKIELIFDEYNLEYAQNLLKNSIQKLSKDKREKMKRTALDLQNVEESTLISFIHSTHIVEASYEKLLRLARFPPSMSSSIPVTTPLSVGEMTKQLSRLSEVPEHQEILVTNIFEVSSIPKHVFLAPCDIRRPLDLLSYTDTQVFPFILKKGMLLTFSDLTDPKNKLSEFVDQSLVKTNDAKTVFTGSDRKFWLIQLMNESLFSHLRSIGMSSFHRGRFYFPPQDNQQLYVVWNSGLKRSEREITTFKTKKGQKGFWKQKAVSVNFRIMNGEYILVLSPGFLFTTDGKTPVNPKLMTKLSSRTWSRYGNYPLLNDVRFWVGFISNYKSPLEIDTGGEPIRIQTQCDQINYRYGLSNDYSPHLIQPISNPYLRKYWRSIDTTTQVKLDETENDIPSEDEENGPIEFFEEDEFDQY